MIIIENKELACLWWFVPRSQLHHLRCCLSSRHHKYADISTQLKENWRKRMHRNVFSFSRQGRRREGGGRAEDGCVYKRLVSILSRFPRRSSNSNSSSSSSSSSSSHRYIAVRIPSPPTETFYQWPLVETYSVRPSFNQLIQILFFSLSTSLLLLLLLLPPPSLCLSCGSPKTELLTNLNWRSYHGIIP